MKNNYKVIQGNEICEIQLPAFGGRYDEEKDYHDFLEKIQKFIIEFENTGNVEPPLYKSMNEIEKGREERFLYNNFYHTFINETGRIAVEKLKNASYRPVYNGHHWMYVAKKYNLKILVYLI